MIPHELKNFRQFINWKPVWNEQKQKYDKIPFDFRAGFKIDAHNPINHRSFEDAANTGNPVAFVLTGNDPFWCLDMDDAAGPDGQWQPWALAACERFPGAFVEVSHSGKGLHVWGCGTAPEGHSKTFTIDGIKYEFYTQRRVIALGSNGAGNIWQDYTPNIAAFVPRSTNGTVGGEQLLSDKPVPEYTGPEDDEELIAKMLQTQSGRQAFGNAAPTTALWNANAAILGAFFPSQTGQPFDHNAADQALMNAIAFWTGKNCARMVRLFSRSQLAQREKWITRPYYQIKTANAAYAACRMVYTYEKTPEQKAKDEKISRAIEAGELLSVFDQTEFFQGCVYVHDVREIYHLEHGLMKPANFRVIFGGHEFSKGSISKKTTWDAYEAFTQSTGFKVVQVDQAGFNPNLDPGAIYTIDGITFVNTYRPCPVNALQGDVSKFLNHVEMLVPDPRDRCYLLGWMAAVVQNPGKKYRWMPVLQGVEGNGKSLFINIMQRAVGRPYSFILPAKKIDEKNNGFMANRLFVGIHEIYVSHKREVVDTLKEWIADDSVSTEEKYIKMGMIENYVNWFGCTNHKNAIPKSKNDRRYFVLFTPQQDKDDLEKYGMHPQYFNGIWFWLEHADGYAMVTNYLKTMQIPDEFHPGKLVSNAPVSSMETDVLIESRTELQRKIVELIEDEEPGFVGNIISGQKINDAVGDKYSGNAIRNALKELGWIKHPALPNGKATNRIFEENGKRPYLYVKVGSVEEKYDPQTVMQVYIQNQSYEFR